MYFFPLSFSLVRDLSHILFIFCQEEEMGEDNGPINPFTDMYMVLEGSALVPFIEAKLQAQIIAFH